MDIEIEQNSSSFLLDEMNNITSKPHYSGGLESVFSANRIFYAAALVEYYYTPLLCAVGCLGNSLSLLVFCFNANQPSLSSSYYLSALAISDTGFLLTLFVFWLDPVGVGVLSSNFGCPFIMFSGQVTCFLSVWLTVAFSGERWVAVCNPLRRSSVCTVAKAKKVISTLTLFSIIAFSYTLIIAQVVETDYFLPSDNENSTTQTSNKSMIGIKESLTTESLMQLQFPVKKHTYSENSTFAPVFDCPEISVGSDGNCQRRFDEEKDGFDDSYNFLLPPVTGYPDDAVPGDGTRLGSSIDGNGLETGISSMNDMFNSTKVINLNKSDGYDEKEEPSSYTGNVKCTVPSKYITVSIIANYLDSVITLIVPFCLITYFNMRIAVCIWKLKDERKRMVVRVRTVNDKPLQRTPSTQTQQSKGLNTYFSRISRSSKRQEECQEMLPITKASGGGGESICLNNEKLEQAMTPMSNAETNETKLGFQQEVNGEEENKFSFIKTAEFEDFERATCSNKSLISSIRVCKNKMLCANHCNCNPDISTNNPSVYKDEQNPSLQKQQIKSLKNLIPKTINGIRGMNRRGNFKENGNNIITQSVSTHSSEARVTKMLLLVSTVFLVLNFPSHFIRLTVFFQSVLWQVDIETQQTLHAIQQLFDFALFNTNFAVNFLLYCLSGRNFRTNLLNVLFGRCHKKSRRSPMSTNNTIVRRTVRFGGPKEGEHAKNREATELQDMTDNRFVHDNNSPNKSKKIGKDFETVELETMME